MFNTSKLLAIKLYLLKLKIQYKDEKKGRKSPRTSVTKTKRWKIQEKR